MKTTFAGVFVLLFGVIEAYREQKFESHDNGLNCSYQSCSSDLRSCHCDSFCTYFGDCCEDHRRYQDTFSAVFWNRVFPHNSFLQCRAIPGYWKGYYGVDTNCPEDTYWMVSRCPPTTSKTEKEKCETEHSSNDLVKVGFLRPVHDALGNIFKNYYCAKCHGTPSEEITLWSVDQVCRQCPDELPMSQNHYANLSSSHCDILLESSVKIDNTNASDVIDARLRWCDKDMIRSCPPGSNAYYSKMCSRFMSPGYFKGSYFKNVFCAKCYGLHNVMSWSCESLEDCRGFQVYPVSAGVSYFDPLCSLIRCSRPNYLCDDRNTRQYISLVVDDSLECAYLEERGERCFFQKSTLSNAMLPWKKMNSINSLMDGNRIRKNEITIFQLPDNASTDWRIKLDEDLVNNARKLSQTEHSCYLEFIEVTEVCSDQDWEQLGECNGELLNVDGDKILDDKYFITKLKLNFTNDMLPIWYSVHTRFPFEPRSYPEKRTLVCFTYPTVDQRRIWDKLFCGICIAVAIVGHVATFCTYAAFKPLRNTFGISLMSLVISLAIALCLQEFVNDYVINVAYLCEAVAIVSHFFWLASFTWMNVLAWDLRATLSLTKMRVRKPSSRKRLGAYCCFGWGMPLLVVTTCIIMWKWNFHGLSIRYGPVRDFTCWISDDLTSLAAVGGPLALCMVANAILFTMVARSLYKHKKSSEVLDAEKDPKQHKRKVIELMIYVKISALMGFSWIFGFFADFTKIDVLRWLFYLSYLVQAVVIFVFFSLSPRARKMWKSSSTTSTKITSGVKLSSHSK
ncbi:Adhesion G-protein coupled receptor G6 [Holothuria leucospilota]|uniref:Adhesion G-protein coupled receptor G6 n=1 Tax=Holothuria leucospilota TaxID=206669 RepID=A0A9Q1HCD4_HOLLE|nr:Adhesion G-protein coupled receptor G6 [Holothuria leucospilota]